MRKLDKTEILALQYKEWMDAFAEDANQSPYNSSNGKFYYDIIANLIWIQKGLCAYTESFMQDCSNFTVENWKDGIFHKFQFAGELDHYNPELKENKGWLWSNFFLIDSDTNSKKVKGDRIPIGILKPDKINFNPFDFLEYDWDNHIFRPSSKRSFIEQEQILHDLNTLGLNWQPTVEKRGKYLDEKLNDVKFGGFTYDEVHGKLYQFFTAFELCKEYMLS